MTTSNDPREAVEEAIRRGDGTAALTLAPAAGMDPGEAFRRAWNVNAYRVDTVEVITLERAKQIESDNMNDVLSQALALHSGHRSLTDAPSFIFRNARGPTHNRDMPWAAHVLLTHDALTDEAARDFLTYAWTVPEFPEGNLTRGLWIEMFRKVGFVTDEEEPEPLPEQLLLYRGAINSRRRGLAWTGSLERGQWFAERFGDALKQRAYLWTVEVPARAVLARFGGRGEDEYVVDLRGFKPRLFKPSAD